MASLNTLMALSPISSVQAAAVASDPKKYAKAAEKVAGAPFKFVDNVTGAKKAREDAAALAKQQMDRQVGLENEAKARLEREESGSAAAAARDQALKRQRAQRSAAQRQSQTLLTGPSGVSELGSGTGKTLLGS